MAKISTPASCRGGSTTTFEWRDEKWQALELLLYAYTAPDVPPGPSSPAGGAPANGGDAVSMIAVPRDGLVASASFLAGWCYPAPNDDA
jgi:hypothetical protein